MATLTLGSLTLGDTLVSQSVADPLQGLLDPTSSRVFVLKGSPLSGGSPSSVGLSTTGYKSQSTDTPEQVYPSAILRPYNFTVNLPLPAMAGGAQLGIGDLSAKNQDGSLDSAALLDWLGVDARVYMGPPEPAPFTQFTEIFHGKSAGLVWDLDTVNILHRDLRYSLQNRLQRNRYRGMGAQIRLNGTTAYASGTVTCPVGSMSIGMWTRPTSDVISDRVMAGYRNGTAAGLRSLAWSGSGQNRPSFAVRNDAGTVFEALYTTAISSTTPHYIEGILDVANSLVRLTIDGVQVATSAISGTFNTVLTNWTIGKLPDGSSLYYPGECDDVRMWSKARTVTEILADKDHELLGTETSLAHYWKMNEGSGTTLADSVSGGVSLTLTNGTWIGSLEGDTSLYGVVKPICVGKRRQVEPKWVDSQRLVLQVSDSSIQAINAVRDKGDPLTFGSDLSDIYSATPAAGTYNTCLAKGLIRLGSSPVGTITVDVQGHNSGSLGYTSSAANCHRKVISVYGGVSDPAGLDTLAYTTLNSLNSAVVGFYFDKEINIDIALDEIMLAISAWWAPTRVGLATVGRISNPATQTPTVTWTQEDLDISSGMPYRREPWGPRVGEVVLGYRPYHRTLTADQVAGTVSLANRDDFSKEYRYVRSVDPNRTADANTITILTTIDEVADAQAESDRILAFLKNDLDKITLNLDSGALSHFIGTIASLTIEQTNADGVTISRYNTAGGKGLAVIGIAEDMGQYGSTDKLSVTCVGLKD